ncbi:alpha/beta fold hydrolase [Pseudarthrobacter enclensis]|uniref:Pimeloyl-ACP methyl ester carboxylesterase n=1 Tax=Pseudarthrobacter enclensis TaxID=993070 RepID=A0ABT9RX73_9MICC|nr:alpha/beta hydrolase [Pseudarthrobacter enclensis]MDP9889845.1 pimeloyl-ACP methyl ester carboxylesterase [Pseudarthrobacter enclensis]
MTKTQETGTVSTVLSPDGTSLSVERMGTGPSLVLVDGAFCGRNFGPARALANELKDAFTVYFYDRRGRGDSSETLPYATEREIEDLQAVLNEAGSSPYVYGISSGAALALEAAAAGVPMRRLATYEAPYTGVQGADGTPGSHREHLEALLKEGKRGSAVSYFLVKMVGAPAFLPYLLRLMPGVWKKQIAAANTLPYETRVTNNFVAPLERLRTITVPTLVMVGGKAGAPMAQGQRAIAGAIAGSEYRVLDGQTHQVSAAAIATQLRGFFSTGT